jgi:predicted phosphodiesterase
MRLVEREIICNSRSVAFKVYGIGDVHIGALNCAEKEIKALVKKIKDDPFAYWIGGGDYCDAVILGDIKRFDVNTLPNWMLEGNANTVKERIGDILYAQRKRFVKIMMPIKDKCLGLIEGNHEYSIFKYHNRDHMGQLCQELDAQNLSDCAFMRIKFRRKSKGKGHPSTKTVVIFISHGTGGGRTSGAEPNKLYRLAADKDADIILTGHTHTFCILPPLAIIGMPGQCILRDDEEAVIKEKHAANWGSFVYTYKSGPSTYASRALYPVRPMYTVETVIKPFASTRVKGKTMEKLDIVMNEIKIN